MERATLQRHHAIKSTSRIVSGREPVVSLVSNNISDIKLWPLDNQENKGTACNAGCSETIASYAYRAKVDFYYEKTREAVAGLKSLRESPPVQSLS
jgi:hypothetical protein